MNAMKPNTARSIEERARLEQQKKEARQVARRQRAAETA
jgi:hypothetical protein